MTRAAKLTLLLPVLAALLFSQLADGAPIPGATGAFGIAPARRYVVSNPGISLEPTIVSNTTSSAYQVSVFPVMLKQNLTGAFDFSSAPRDLSAAKLVLSVSPTSFAMSPGQQQQVNVQWNLLPHGTNWVAPGLVFQGVPQGQHTSVHVITRLLNVNFLRLPGPVRVDGIFTGLFPQQFKPQVLRFVARVKNTGDDFTAPSDGQLTIRNASGRTVLTQPWKGIQMLPGATVDFPIEIEQILQAGHYTATVTMSFGGPRSKTVPFTLVGPNQLPTPAVTIQNFNASGTVGSPAQVTARVISSGTAPASVTLRLYLGTQGEAPGQNALATATVVYRNLAPGSVTQLSRPLGGALKKESYRAVVTWTDPTGAPHTLEAEFTALEGKSWLQAIWDWIKDHWWIFLLLAFLAVIAYVYNRERQRQRRTESELAAARAALTTRQAEPDKELVALPAGSVGDERASAQGPESDPPSPGPGSEWEPRPNPPGQDPSNPHPPSAGNPYPTIPDGNPGHAPMASAIAATGAVASAALDPGTSAPSEPALAPDPTPGPQAEPAPLVEPLPDAQPLDPGVPASSSPGPAPPGPPAHEPARRLGRKRAVAAAAVVALGAAGAVAVIRWRNRR